MWVIRLRRRGHRWPLKFSLAFFLLGLGSYAVISFGFLGTYSQQLRWAFTTRLALLLLVVPALVALGKPIALARMALHPTKRARMERLVRSRPLRIMGNAMVGPIFTCAVFLLFLTPVAAILRESYMSQLVTSFLAPAAGLLFVVPIAAGMVVRTAFFITIEFLLAFVEVLLDSIPGIALRINDSVLDHATRLVANAPAWFPSPLRDQYLSGDLLWFIAEMADIPILILLFLRWMRLDRREGTRLDDLSDEQMDELTRAHLQQRV